MKLLRFAFLQLKKGLKDKKVLAFTFLMPVIVITGIYYAMMSGGGYNTYSDIAINVADKGQLSKTMLKELKIDASVYYNLESKAIESLKKNDIKAVYTLPKDFSEKIKAGIKPEIVTYKNVEGNSTTPFEGIVDNWINQKVKVAMLINNGIIKNEAEIPNTTIKVSVKGPESPLIKGQFFALLMIINFMIFSANTIGMELLALKKQHILSRAITTANKGYEIIGGIYLGTFLLQLVVYTAVYLIEKQVMGFSLGNFPLVLLNMSLLSLVSTSLGILVVRVFENESMVALTINLFGIITTFLGMAGLNVTSHKASWVVENLSKFTPQYWVMNSIDSGAIIPNSLILILMSLVLFTAGNYKIRNFVNR